VPQAVAELYGDEQLLQGLGVIELDGREPRTERREFSAVSASLDSWEMACCRPTRPNATVHPSIDRPKVQSRADPVER
jgi:hypothetical protein